MNDLELKDAVLRAGSEPDAGTRDSIRAVVAGELRGERTTVVTPTTRTTRRDWRRPAAVLTAAACVAVVAVGVVLLTGGDEDSVTNSPSPELSTPSTSAPPTTAPAPTTDLLDALVGRRWVAVEYDGRPVSTPTTPWVEFSDDPGEPFARGQDGCNWFAGQGRLEGDLLSFGEVESTAALCGERLPVITPLDGLRLVIENDSELHMSDEGGAERITYVALDSLDAAAPASLVALWSGPAGGTIPAIDIRDDGSAEVGTCALSWSSTNGRLSVEGWPADPYSCRADVIDEGSSRMIELLAGGTVDARVAPDGASLYLASDELVVGLVREVDEAPPADPTTVDMLAGWPQPPAGEPDLANVPLLFPSVPIDGVTDVMRVEGADDPWPRAEYVQTWIGDPGQVMRVTTQFGDPLIAPTANGETVEVAGWDTAEFGESVPGITILVLTEPSGSVIVWGKDVDDSTVLAFAGALTLRSDGVAGWDQPLDGWPIPVHEAWVKGTAVRAVRWYNGDALVAEMGVFWGVPDLFVPWALDADIFAVELVNGTTGVGSLLADRAAVVWSPAPDVTVILGVVGPMDQAIALANSVEPVDEATWEAASRLDTAPRDGCDGMFC